MGCTEPLEPRAAEVASVMAEADLALIRSRPALVAGKYRRMAGDPFSYYRGSLSVFRHDWEAGAFGLSASRYGTPPGSGTATPLPLALGDAHPENFGLLRAQDGSFAL